MRLVFAGTPEFAAVSLAAVLDAGHRVVAVYTQPDRPSGRGRKLLPGPVKQLAARHSLPIEQPPTLRRPEVEERLRRYRPDLIVVAAYGLILPRPILDLPARGCVNVHASILPRWRGAAPIQRALLAGDRETGISIMQMDVGLDTGPVLSVTRTPIAQHDTGGSLHDRLGRIGAEAIVAALPGILDGSLEPVPQPDEGVTYARRIEKEEAQLRWGRPAVELERQVRALDPWPVAETRWQGQRLRIWSARSRAASGAPASPGTIAYCTANGIGVATGDGILELREVQRPGGKRLAVSAYLNAVAHRPGERLGAESPDP